MKTSKASTLFFTLFTGLLIFTSCIKTHCTDCENDIDETKTNLRIKNVSNYDFEEISINPNGNLKSYGNLDDGKTSCYHNFNMAYDYAYVKLTIDGKEFVLQPIDYVGEEELGIGKFTYSIDVESFAQRRLSISASPD